MAIRLYHLANELNLDGSELLSLLKQRGLEFNSVMTVLDETKTTKARQVATGEVEIKKPEKGRLEEIKLPPPVVPAPARPIRPAPTMAYVRAHGSGSAAYWAMSRTRPGSASDASARAASAWA